ncbi:hypothetical protein Tsubulata_023566 [Turnera subulata]|uniref:TF-B3 domain-containing protein n=1 Tax=Turnera subulata TaxID=218843 RepID=A0A9Q0JH94_9ROSI|nr:hypothetical protein Tsubulata_049086 [Turnera subulata]KAJ4840630.1 hypothetical protein Tsubulata_023566 [Turnera subulata]
MENALSHAHFWNVRYNVYLKQGGEVNQATLRGGWKNFLKHNPISRDDIVLFEYIGNQNPQKMKVYILKSEGESAGILLQKLEAEENVDPHNADPNQQLPADHDQDNLEDQVPVVVEDDPEVIRAAGILVRMKNSLFTCFGK